MARRGPLTLTLTLTLTPIPNQSWDEDGNGTISKPEFRKALPMLGIRVPTHEVDALFDS